jgi:protein SHQ1
MLECPNPDEVISNEEDSIWQEEQQRRELRLHIENEKFDKDRYLNDLDIENEGDMIFDSAVMMKPHWTMEISESKEKCDSFFSSDESHLLAELPRLSNTPANLSIEQKKSGFLCLLDILFAYVYDHRTTDGDPTVESSWTVMISSPTLSWLECYNSPYDTISDVIRWSIRRSLIYPYIRSYNLAKHIAEDVCIIMKRGRRTILRCLLQLHKIMEQSESHYLFNKLYIDPMIGWIQQCDEDDVKQFGNELEKLCKAEDSCSSDLFGKYHLGLDLEDIEKRFFESDGEKHESSYDDDDEDISCSVDYESDDESGGDTEITTDEEGAQTSGEEEKYSELLENAMEKLVVNEDS